VEEDSGTTSADTSGDTVLEGTPAPPTPEELAGYWVSGVRQTTQGPMRFTVWFGSDGRLEITGTPTDTAPTEEFRRSGRYHLAGDSLVSPVINQGRPARLALRERRLTLTIDDTLTLRLSRQ
jgi:hypothetical protein